MNEEINFYEKENEERTDMEITVEKKGTADMEQTVNGSAYKQQKNSLERAVEWKEVKLQHDAKKKPISYDAASLHGDTLSVSEAGKTASSQKGSRLVNKDATDGIVIRKEASI